MLRKCVRRLLLIITTVHSCVAFSQEYEVSGHFTYRAFEQGEKINFEMQGDFTVAVKDCLSQIKYVPTQNGDRVTEKDGMLAFDGVNYYQLIRAPDPKVVPGGKVSVGSIPERCDQKLGMLWLGYASHCYFKNADADFIHSPAIDPPDSMDLWAKDHRVRARWSKETRLPGLPTNIVHSYQYAFEKKDSTEVVSNFVYEVTETTNVGGATIPKSFAVRVFFPPGNLISSFDVEATQFSKHVELTGFSPPISGKLFVTEERFISSDKASFAYLVTGQKWPSVEQGRTQLREYLRREKRADATLNSNRSVLYGVFAMLLLIAPALLLLRSKKQTKT